MGRTQLIVLSQPQGRNIADLEDAVRRSVEFAPIDFVDAVQLAKNDNDAIEFTAVSDISNPGRVWRGLLARALFGMDATEKAPWSPLDSLDAPDPIIDLKEVHLLEISDRIPRNSSSLLVLVEHHWMDELGDDHIAQGHLVATGWISIRGLLELCDAQPHRRPI